MFDNSRGVLIGNHCLRGTINVYFVCIIMAVIVELIICVDIYKYEGVSTGLIVHTTYISLWLHYICIYENPQSKITLLLIGIKFSILLI